jgi:hypothetical protein
LKRSVAAGVFSLVLPVMALAATSASPSVHVPSPAVNIRLKNVKLMNYYPSRFPWGAMWVHWDRGQLNADFVKIAALNANTVRLVLQPAVFGYPRPRTVMLERLTEAVGLAEAHGLRVQLTLFDGWSGYSDFMGSRKWAQSVLGRFRLNRRVESVELQNEIDPTNPAAMGWARKMIPALRLASAYALVTVSPPADVASLSRLHNALGTVQPDFYSYHYYGGGPEAYPTLQQAKEIVAPKPLFVGETGLSTGTGPSDPALEQQQVTYLAAVEKATKSLGLPAAAPWILKDFAPDTLTVSDSAEYHFGVFRSDGSEKPAAAWLRQYFLLR